MLVEENVKVKVRKKDLRLDTVMFSLMFSDSSMFSDTLRSKISKSQSDFNHSLNRLKLKSLTITNKVEILLISETKLNSSFPLNQFHIDGFTIP